MANGLNGLRRLLRATGLLCVSIASGIAVYLVAAVAGGLIAGPAVTPLPGVPAQTIALVAGPIHTDLLLPLTPDIRTAFAFSQGDKLPVSHPNARWLIVGWGARGVYTTLGDWGDVRLPILLRAVTGDTAVMRLDITGAFDMGGVTLIPVTDAQLATLTSTIRASMTDTPLPDHGFTDTDRYYPATGRFHIMRTCNVWVGETLRAAGVPFGIWTPTPYAMRLSLWRFHSNTRWRHSSGMALLPHTSIAGSSGSVPFRTRMSASNLVPAQPTTRSPVLVRPFPYAVPLSRS